MRERTPKMSSPTPKYQMGDYIDDNYEVHAAPPAPTQEPEEQDTTEVLPPPDHFLIDPEMQAFLPKK